MDEETTRRIVSQTLGEWFDDIVKDVVDRIKIAEKNYPRKRYVRVMFCLGFPNERKHSGSRTYYTYEDPWGDLEVDDLVERPSGLAKVVAVDVRKDDHQAPFKLTARYRKEV